jgi:hypothetical protein
MGNISRKIGNVENPILLDNATSFLFLEPSVFLKFVDLELEGA